MATLLNRSAPTRSRSVGLDATTVRRRIKRLEADGVLQGFAATPAAAAFGRTPRTLEFHAPGAGLSGILAIDDVAWAANTYDDRVWVHVYEGADQTATLTRLLGPPTAAYQIAEEPDPTILGRIDLKVLRALLVQPRASIQDLCAATGLTAKTVRNHRASLISKRFVRVEPLLRPPSAANRLYYHMTVHLDTAQAAAAIRALREAFVVSAYNDARDLYVFLADDGLAKQAARVEAIRAVAGVRDATTIVTREYALAMDRLLAWCDQGIARIHAAAATAPTG